MTSRAESSAFKSPRLGAVTILLHADEWIEIPERHTLISREHVVSVQIGDLRMSSDIYVPAIYVATAADTIALGFHEESNRNIAYNDLKSALFFCKTSSSPVHPNIAEAKARLGLNVSE